MEDYYQNVVNKTMEKPKYIKNMMFAFLFGGGIALIGQALIELYRIFGLSDINSQSLMITTLIFTASLLTGLGVFDKIGQYGKCGTSIPITGFANSMTCAAIEGRSEGIILGIGVSLLKLAGVVITFGVISAFIVGTIKYLIWLV